MRTRLAALTWTLVLAAASWAAPPPDPVGPEFGTGRIEATLIEQGDEPDLDQYVARLIRGEQLSVRVTAPGESAVRPTLGLIGPDGAPRPVELKTRRGGRRVSFARYTVDDSGPWVLRIGDAARNDGAYALQTRIRAPRTVRVPRRTVRSGGQPDEHAIDAIQGATLELKLTNVRKSALADVTALLDPGDDAVPGALALAIRKGRTVRLTAALLAAGDGIYRAQVATAAEEAAYKLRWRVRPPTRPRGRVVLGPEPHVNALAEPLEAPGNAVITLRGAGFGTAHTIRCWLGELEAAVLDVAVQSDTLRVVVPVALPEEPVSVLVQNEDGQFARREAAVRRTEPRVLDVLALSPAQREASVGTLVPFRVFLTDPAPSLGTDVGLAVEGVIGTVPPVVHVEAGATVGGFDLVTAADPASGRILATLGRTVAAEVNLVAGPPDPDPDPDPATLDLSGWQLQQEDSARTFTFPVGTEVVEGGYLIVGRDGTRTEFSLFWGEELDAATVVYLDSEGFFPTVNGEERYTLRDPAGTAVDGPTVRMPASAGHVFQRVPGGDAGAAASWQSGTSIFANATPGSGQAKQATGIGVYISEFSDAPGPGNYPNEFVEIFFDGPLPE